MINQLKFLKNEFSQLKKKNWGNNVGNRLLDHKYKQYLNLKEIEKSWLIVEMWKLKKLRWSILNFFI
jgi:hypothetical protein